MNPTDIWGDASPATRRLVLLRHGRTAWNATARAQGHANVPLDAVGQAQAARAAEQLASYEPSFVWSSDLARARETAEALVGLLPHVELVLDQRLREYHIGIRQGLTMPEFAERHPDIYARFITGDDATGGETPDQVRARMVAVISDAAAAVRPGETGVLVGHGASLRTGLLAFFAVPPEHDELLAGMANCAWAVLQLRTRYGWQIVDYNAQTLPEPVTIADDPHG